VTWNKHQATIIQDDIRKTKIDNCMSTAEQNYNNSIAKLCRNSAADCKFIIAVAAPKLLDAINNTLNKEQEICVKLASQ
jgi:hypothetical protein